MVRMQPERLLGSTALPTTGGLVDFVVMPNRLRFRAAVRGRSGIRSKRKS